MESFQNGWGYDNDENDLRLGPIYPDEGWSHTAYSAGNKRVVEIAKFIASSEPLGLLHIVGDYEEISALLISRYIMQSVNEVCAYPLPVHDGASTKAIVVFEQTSLDKAYNEKTRSRITQLFEEIRIQLGLLVSWSYPSSETVSYAADSENDGTIQSSSEHTNTANIQQLMLVHTLSHRMLTQQQLQQQKKAVGGGDRCYMLTQQQKADRWFTFSEDGQTFGVFARFMNNDQSLTSRRGRKAATPLNTSGSVDHTVAPEVSYLEVVAIKRCDRKSEDSSGRYELEFQTSVSRIVPFQYSELQLNNSYSRLADAADTTPAARDRTYPIDLCVVTTGEQVQLEGQDAYLGVLSGLSSSNISRVGSNEGVDSCGRSLIRQQRGDTSSDDDGDDGGDNLEVGKGKGDSDGSSSVASDDLFEENMGDHTSVFNRKKKNRRQQASQGSEGVLKKSSVGVGAMTAAAGSCSRKGSSGGENVNVLGESPIALTALDIKNRQQGYCLFLPDTKEKLELYCRLGYGFCLVCDGEDSAGMPGYHMVRVRCMKGDERVLPLQLLFRSVAEVPSRSAKHAQSTADAFIDTLRLCDPTLFQDHISTTTNAASTTTTGSSTTGAGSHQQQQLEPQQQEDGRDYDMSRSRSSYGPSTLTTTSAAGELRSRFVSAASMIARKGGKDNDPHTPGVQRTTAVSSNTLGSLTATAAAGRLPTNFSSKMPRTVVVSHIALPVPKGPPPTSSASVAAALSKPAPLVSDDKAARNGGYSKYISPIATASKTGTGTAPAKASASIPITKTGLSASTATSNKASAAPTKASATITTGTGLNSGAANNKACTAPTSKVATAASTKAGISTAKATTTSKTPTTSKVSNTLLGKRKDSGGDKLDKIGEEKEEAKEEENATATAALNKGAKVVVAPKKGPPSLPYRRSKAKGVAGLQRTSNSKQLSVTALKSSLTEGAPNEPKKTSHTLATGSKVRENPTQIVSQAIPMVGGPNALSRRPPSSSPSPTGRVADDSTDTTGRDIGSSVDAGMLISSQQSSSDSLSLNLSDEDD